MNSYNLLKISFKALQKNIFRSLLTMLGIIIGVASVIAMLSIGEGSKKSIEDSISSLGSNLITISPGAKKSGGVNLGSGTSRPFELKDFKAIEKNCTLLQWVSPVASAKVQTISGANNWLASITGAYPSYIDIKSMTLKSGQRFTDNDVKRAAKVCIIGATVAKELFGEFVDPIGQTIRMKNIPFKIIGLLDEKGAGMMGQDQDDVVIAPFTTVQKRLIGSTKIPQILASAYSEDTMEEAIQEIERVLAKQMRVQPEEEAFSIKTMSEISTMVSSTSDVLMVLLASVAGISLIVGGIGIMNIMYVTVTERTREIGLRLAVGAKGRDILLQFLTEAIVISLIGGILGIIIGVIISFAFGAFMGWTTIVSSFSIILAFGFSTLIGVFFGWYPARKAANLLPIEALRYE